MFLTSSIFDDMLFDFIRDGYFFNSAVLDMKPAAFYKKGKDYIVEVKTLGISADDVKLELNESVLTVSGETKNEYDEKSFNAKVGIKLGKQIVDNIESIDYSTKDGITYVFLRMKETKEDTIQINRI